MIKKYYAIKKGLQNNIIVDTWDECENLVSGVSRAKFKSFKTKQLAESYLNIKQINLADKKTITPKLKVSSGIKIKKKNKRGVYQLYGYCTKRGMFEGKERCLERFVGTTENGIFTEAMRP